MKTSKILTTSILIAASAALANAAENTVLWSANNINLGTSEDKTFTTFTIPTGGITLKLDVSNWNAQNSAFCWLTTTAGNTYKNSGATIGWGKKADEQGGSILFNLNGSATSTTVSGDGFNRSDAFSYSGTGSATQNVSTVLFVTVQSGTATLYEKNKDGNAVVKVASISNMKDTSTINGLHIGSWNNLNHSGTMDAALYSGVLSTDTMNNILNVPEPSMFGVFAGLGALALAGSRRRRKI